MINKITRETVGDVVFDLITEDYYAVSYKEHRKQSNFYMRRIFEVDEALLPDHPELWGFWESNTFIYDSVYGLYGHEITDLIRVEKKTKTIVKECWEAVESGEK